MKESLEIGDLVGYGGHPSGIVVGRNSDCIFLIYFFYSKRIQPVFWDSNYKGSLKLVNKAK